MTKRDRISHNSAFMKLHLIGLAYVCLVAFVMVGATVLALFGVIPWFSILVPINGSTATEMGPLIQITLTGLALTLVAFLPSSFRVLKLEDSHRGFYLTMDDVAQAYYTSHQADRAGVFTLSAEFDAVRERINFMRGHPDLNRLEPGVMEAAAQMSQISRDLAETYSDETVERAKSVLRQRQVELEDFSDQLAVARKQTDEVKRWVQQIEVEGSIADSQLAQLKQDLAEILPGLGLKVIRGPKQPLQQILERTDSGTASIIGKTRNVVKMSEEKGPASNSPNPKPSVKHSNAAE